MSAPLLYLLGLCNPIESVSRSGRILGSKLHVNKRGVRRTRRLLIAEPLEPRIVLDSTAPYLVSDISTAPLNLGLLNLVEVGGIFFFSASEGIGGYELWKSDGTQAGTVLVKEIQPGIYFGGSDPRNLINMSGTLYFTADNGIHGEELWKSDGTEEGTVLVKDIWPSSFDAIDSSTASLTNLGGMLYFMANDGIHGQELWKSDGTQEGTVLVKDIRPGPDGTPTNSFTNVDGTLYFTAYDGVHGWELWKSDGTQDGTVLVKDIRSGVGYIESIPKYLTNVSGTLYFRADDGIQGEELWKSDGTQAGTALVKDIWSGPFGSGVTNLTNVSGTLYFDANDMIHGLELWKSDGTQQGTVLVKDIEPGSGDAYCSSLTDVSGTLYFISTVEGGNKALWKSDGTEEGTINIKSFLPSFSNGMPGGLINAAGTLYFEANDGIHGVELWKSDGTEEGTVRVKDIRPGIGNSSFAGFQGNQTNVAGTLYFAANDGIHGYALWTSDGTEAGTVLVKDICIQNYGSLPKYLTNVSGALYFVAKVGPIGWELWKSDGTQKGTGLVKDIRTGSYGSFVGGLTNMSGTLYFAANDGTSGFELWKSDGTEAGTVRVSDIWPGVSGSNPSHLTNVNGVLYFSANRADGSELWKSDGTEGGTVRVKDIQPGSFGSNPNYLTNIAGTLYFTANDGASGYELWKSDGSDVGTVRVKDVRLGFDNSDPRNFTDVGGTLYFYANDGISGVELWKSDGTNLGTVLVKDILLGSGNSYPRNLTNLSGTLFFSANDGTSGFELWKSDGTEVGTVRVKDIRSGSSVSNPKFLTNVAGKLYFRANDGASGSELWKSDGTEAGTVRIKDIQPGFGGSQSFYSSYFAEVTGSIYFAANDGTSGDELWKSDGTEEGTVRVEDIFPGAGLLSSSFPKSLINVAGTLFFSADDGVHGPELWAIPAATPAQVVNSRVYYKGSSFASGGVSNALDPEKTLAKEGAVPIALSYDNLINSSRGINGLVFDIDNLPANQMTSVDFEFQISPLGAFYEQANPVQDWQSAPTPASITVEPSSPSRVVIEWPDNAIANRWLRVTLKANANTGLAAEEVYYIGHLLGETTGTSSGKFAIEFADVVPIRNAVGQPVNVSSIADIDKNGEVTFTDIGIMRPRIRSQLTNITIPAAGSLIPGVNLPPLGRDAKGERNVAMLRKNVSTQSNQATPFVEDMLTRSAATLPDRSVVTWPNQSIEQGGLITAQLSPNRSVARTLESSGVTQKRPTAAASSKLEPTLVHTHRDRVFESWDQSRNEENHSVNDSLEPFILDLGRKAKR